MTRRGHVHHVTPQRLQRHRRPAPDNRQQPRETDQAGRIWPGELPTSPSPLPALRRQARLDPPTHNPTLKRGEPIYLLQQAPAYAFIYDPASWTEMIEWSAATSNAWRTGTDIANADAEIEYQWQTIVRNLRDTMPFQSSAQPGHFNDADFLIVGNGIPINEARVQMASWSMLASPMILSTDLRDLRPDELSLLTNSKIIAVSQDPLGMQAEVVVDDGTLSVLRRPLENGDWAVAVVNVSDGDAEFELWSAELFNELEVVSTDLVNVFTNEALTDVAKLSVQRRDVSMFVLALQK